MSRLETINIPISLKGQSKSSTLSSTSEADTQFEISISEIVAMLSSMDDKIFVKKPMRVLEGALDNFHTELHKNVKTLKDLTDDDLEKLIGERNNVVPDDE